jgi:hypothetical protein
LSICWKSEKSKTRADFSLRWRLSIHIFPHYIALRPKLWLLRCQRIRYTSKKEKKTLIQRYFILHCKVFLKQVIQQTFPINRNCTLWNSPSKWCLSIHTFPCYIVIWLTLFPLHCQGCRYTLVRNKF